MNNLNQIFSYFNPLNLLPKNPEPSPSSEEAKVASLPHLKEKTPPLTPPSISPTPLLGRPLMQVFSYFNPLNLLPKNPEPSPSHEEVKAPSLSYLNDSSWPSLPPTPLSERRVVQISVKPSDSGSTTEENSDAYLQRLAARVEKVKEVVGYPGIQSAIAEVKNEIHETASAAPFLEASLKPLEDKLCSYEALLTLGVKTKIPENLFRLPKRTGDTPSPTPRFSCDPLGQGSFGTAYPYTLNGEEVVVKILNQPQHSKFKQLALTEGLVQSFFQHPRILSVLAVTEDGTIYSEKANQGDLKQFILKERAKATNPDFLLQCAKDVTQAVSFIHERGYAHHDLKPENFFLHEEEGVLRVKVADFGFVTPKDTLQKGVSPYFASPHQIEITREISSSIETHHNTNADWWAFGISLAYLLTDKYLSSADTKSRLISILGGWKNDPQAVKNDLNPFFVLHEKKIKERDPTGNIRAAISYCLNPTSSEEIKGDIVLALLEGNRTLS